MSWSSFQVSNWALEKPALMQCALFSSVSLRDTWDDIDHLQSPVMEEETVDVISSLVLPPGKQKCLRMSAGRVRCWKAFLSHTWHCWARSVHCIERETALDTSDYKFFSRQEDNHDVQGMMLEEVSFATWHGAGVILQPFKFLFLPDKAIMKKSFLMIYTIQE